MATIHIVGRLTDDPKYTEAKNGKSQRVNFAVAEDNEHGDGTSFYDCVAFGKRADVIDKWTFKGKLVYVEGSMEQGDTYTDKNGSKRRSWSVWVNRCKFLDSNKKPSDKDVARIEAEAKSILMPDSFEDADIDNPF